MLADPYDAILLDLDGVLYRGDVAVPGAPETVRILRAAGKGIAFMTNNSSSTPQGVAGRLAALGIPADPSEVATSALTTADLLASRGVGSAFVVGEAGIREALAGRGIELRDGDPDAVDVVVVGFDRAADWAKLARASLLVRGGASVVATNADASYPMAGGLVPGAGALLAAIVTATGASPEVVGKPHAPLFASALERAGGGRPLVVGDRIDTDVSGARALGWDSALVLTGVTSRADLDGASDRPTFVLEDVRGLVD